MTAMSQDRSDRVLLEVPAATVNMAIVRTVAASVAARADLTLDQIEDVRLAVDEAMAHMIKQAQVDSTIQCLLTCDGPRFDAVLICPTDQTDVPQPEPFSWTVLTALVGSIDMGINDGQLTLHITVTREHSVSA